jgi:hypothetical protein
LTNANNLMNYIMSYPDKYINSGNVFLGMTMLIITILLYLILVVPMLLVHILELAYNEIRK